MNMILGNTIAIVGGGDTANTSPVVDLNGGGAGVDASYAYTEGDGAVSVISTAAVTDAENDALATVTIVGTSYAQDAANETVQFSATDFPSNADATKTKAAGATTFEIDYTASSKTFVITKNGGGTMPIADVQTLLRQMQYNNAATPPDTTTRTLTFVANDGTADSATATLTVTVAIASAITWEELASRSNSASGVPVGLVGPRLALTGANAGHTVAGIAGAE